jgi:hypothetical protein
VTPPAKKQAKEPIQCCRKWMNMSPAERNRWEWQVVHQFSHSRATFTAPTLAEYAKVSVEQASGLIKAAETMKWIWMPQEGVWVGRLGTRR